MKKKVLSLILILAIMIMPISMVKANEYFNASENVSDSSTYEHSHFEAGSNVNSSNNVNGLSFVAGANVEVAGNKEYSFVAGESVSVTGKVEKDLFAAGNNVKIASSANIGRDVYVAGNSVSISSNINGAVFAAASIVTLDNVVINGDVKIAANTLQIDGDVVINGKLTINDDVIINNESKLTYSSKEIYNNANVDIDFKSEISDKVLSVLTMLFTGIILVLIFPKLFRKIKYDLEAKDIAKKLLYGLLLLVVVPMISIVALSIMVGMSVAVILILMYVIALMISTILASAVIGQNIYTKLFKQKDNLYISMMIGIIVVKLVEIIPVIGGIVSLLVFLYGLGIICNLFLERNK